MKLVLVESSAPATEKKPDINNAKMNTAENFEALTIINCYCPAVLVETGA